MNDQRILVLGASGYVGSRLIPRLLARGYTIRAVSRRPDSLADRLWANDPRVEIFPADILDPAAAQAACDGCQAGYYLVHSMDASHKDFAAADRQAAQNLARAAAAAGLTRLIYLGGLGGDRRRLSRHLLSRVEVGEILQSGTVPCTVLRAAMIIGAGSASFEILRYLVERLPIMITPRWVHTENQPIAIRNVLTYLAGSLDHPQAAGQSFDIGGPEIVSYRQLMRVFAEEAGHRPRLIIPVPFLTPHLSSYWINLVTPLPAALARPLVEGLKNRVICEDNQIRLLMPQTLISCRRAIRAALGIETLAPDEYAPVRGDAPAEEVRHPGDPAWVRAPRAA